MAANSSGTVQLQRSASRSEPMRIDEGRAATERVVKLIWTHTNVTGSGSACTASLLRMDMPAEESM